MGTPAINGQKVYPFLAGLFGENLHARRVLSLLLATLGVNHAARRWGGNPTSRYNWKLGNVWNTANDYFFRNIVLGTSPQYTADSFLQANQQRGLQSALTVPMLGWVAKDSSSVGFPKSLFGAQQRMDPDVTEAGNGISLSGESLTPLPPTQTSVEAPPSFIHEWVRTLREKDKKRGRGVHQYILDNEPMLAEEMLQGLEEGRGRLGLHGSPHAKNRGPAVGQGGGTQLEARWSSWGRPRGAIPASVAVVLGPQRAWATSYPT